MLTATIKHNKHPFNTLEMKYVNGWTDNHTLSILPSFYAICAKNV